MHLWSNCLLDNGRTLPPHSWMRCGLRRVCDVWDSEQGAPYSVPQLRLRARAHGALKRTTLHITVLRLRLCLNMLPATWTALLREDRAVLDGDLYSQRGAYHDTLTKEHDMGAVWRAVVPPARTSVDPSSGSRVRYQPPTRWKPWSAKDYTRTNTPRVKVHKGHGPAGLPAPVHPPSPRELVLFTDGGCVENALVGEGEQLAGSGCVVLNGSRDDATAAAVRLYGPVITDPDDPMYMGATRGTNNTAELGGVGEALLWLRDYDHTNDDALILVDSQYAAAVVQAQWGFKTNINMVQCVQSVLVEVRARRNVRFEWVHGHSGDRWNDVADDLATLGQDPCLVTRTGCREGRYADEAPRTRLAHDPRTGGTSQLVPTASTPSQILAGCVEPDDEPDIASMHRVTHTRDGTPVGFSRQVFAQQVERVTWGSSHSPTAFSVRAVRNATRHASLGSQGDMHVFAARVVQACPDNLDLRWRSMWREGWSSPWPTITTDRWWRMAAGGQYVAHQRRTYDPATAFCRVCATHDDSLHLDTHQHLYYKCRCQRPLWRWVHDCLAALGLQTSRAAAFMLYGTQTVRPADANASTDTKIAPTTRRALSYVRAATIDAFYTTRAASMRPEATGEHPQAAVSAAAKALRGYIHLDWFSATRAHTRLAHRVLPPPDRARGQRPHGVDTFAAVWHRFAGVRSGARLEWLGPLYDGKGAG